MCWSAKLTNDAPPNKISHCTHISGRDNNVWLKSPFYVRFVHLICKHQQEKPNPAGHPERPLDFPRKRSLNLHAPLRRLFAVIFVPWYACMWSCADNHTMILILVSHWLSVTDEIKRAIWPHHSVFFRWRTSCCVQNFRISAVEKTRRIYRSWSEYSLFSEYSNQSTGPTGSI